MVKVCGMRPHSGQIYMAVYAGPKSFLKADSAIYREILPVEGDTVTFRITELAEGEYAFSVFHDLNGNRNLDVNSLGIPVEAFGFSNNPRSFFGPPTFEQAKVHLAGNTVIIIELMSLFPGENAVEEEKTMTKKERRKEKRKQRRK